MGDSIKYCEQCENRVGCHLARQCFRANDKANGPLDAAAGSPIPAIESSFLNIGTAVNDCKWAKSKWIDGEWNDCVMWISNAIAQLESARSKIQVHQQEENAKLCDGRDDKQ